MRPRPPPRRHRIGAAEGVPTSKISVQLFTFAQHIGFTDPEAVAQTEEIFRRAERDGLPQRRAVHAQRPERRGLSRAARRVRAQARSRHVDVGTPRSRWTSSRSSPRTGRRHQVLRLGRDAGGHYKTEAEWIAYAEYLNEIGARARQAGQRLMVHNHNWEFETVFGDRTAYDILMEHTDRRNVVFQLDLYWVTFAGADPVAAARGVRQAHPALPREGHARERPDDRDRRPRRDRLPGDLRRGEEDPLLRRRARPALRRPDLRSVRGRAGRLRLPRRRHATAAARAATATTTTITAMAATVTGTAATATARRRRRSRRPPRRPGPRQGLSTRGAGG